MGESSPGSIAATFREVVAVMYLYIKVDYDREVPY